MKGLFLTTMLSSLISNGASTTPPVMPKHLPEKCPSITTIASQGLDYVVPYPRIGYWIGVKENSSYDTNDNWTFLIMTPGDKNGKVAIQKISSELSSLEYNTGPEWDDSEGVTICGYNGNQSRDSFALAFTPPAYS